MAGRKVFRCGLKAAEELPGGPRIDSSIEDGVDDFVDGDLGGLRVFDDGQIAEKRLPNQAVRMLPAGGVVEVAEAPAAQSWGAAAPSVLLDVLTTLRARHQRVPPLPSPMLELLESLICEPMDGENIVAAAFRGKILNLNGLFLVDNQY